VVVERGQLIRREQGEERGEAKRGAVDGTLPERPRGRRGGRAEQDGDRHQRPSVQSSSSSKTLSRALVSASAPGRMSAHDRRSRCQILAAHARRSKRSSSRFPAELDRGYEATSG
jgi:hypothetical protein